MMTATFSEVPSRADQEFALTGDEIKRLLDGNGNSISIQDTWPALHFTLTSEVPIPKEEALRRGVDFPADPLEEVLMGGSATSVRTAFGPVRLLTLPEVRQSAQLLSAVTIDDFTDWFDAEALENEHIPPAGWPQEHHRLDDLLAAFIAVRDFYEQAAAKDSGILIAFE
ncbi:DUF1877 family protein [Streptomyces sp. NPDC057136]|uniref:DUF1877 family protein n=1 Tax=Streptomyces sp. NPDC057136 TaxID=3346029 RepID=UPI003635E4FD